MSWDRLHDMAFGEFLDIKPWTITRVPGGWIFVQENGRRTTMTSVFVPYSGDLKGTIYPV